MITWEIQPGRETGFGYYTDNPFGMQITDFQNAKTYGTFMPLSKRISVETYFDGAERFEGICK